MFNIEKGISLPAIGGSPREPKYPFAKMEVGDSFVYTKNGTSWAGIFAAMKKAEKKHNIKLTSRQIGESQRRIWRTT